MFTLADSAASTSRAYIYMIYCVLYILYIHIHIFTFADSSARRSRAYIIYTKYICIYSI